jgi:hypothetical protein
VWSSWQANVRRWAATEQIYIDYIRRFWTEPRSRGLSVLRGETPASANWLLRAEHWPTPPLSRLESRTSELLNYSSSAALVAGFCLISDLKISFSTLMLYGMVAFGMLCLAARLMLYPDLRLWYRAFIAPAHFYAVLAFWFFCGVAMGGALIPSITHWPLQVRDIAGGLPVPIAKLSVLAVVWPLLFVAVMYWLIPAVSRWLTRAAGPSVFVETDAPQA